MIKINILLFLPEPISNKDEPIIAFLSSTAKNANFKSGSFSNKGYNIALSLNMVFTFLKKKIKDNYKVSKVKERLN